MITIKFPFKVKQLNSNQIEVMTNDEGGRPLVSLDLHPCIQEHIKEEDYAEMMDAVLPIAVKAAMIVEFS